MLELFFHTPYRARCLQCESSATVNGQKVAEGRIKYTQCSVFSAGEGADVGIDDGTPVSEAYQAGEPSKFTGKIAKVTVEIRLSKPLDRAQQDELEKNKRLT
jgi:arylsulfatase